MAWGLLLLTALVFWTTQRRILRVATLALTLLYFLLSMPLTANLALGELEHVARQDQHCGPPPAGSIFIVLAGGIEGHPAQATDFTKLKLQSMRRLMSATLIALRIPNSRLLLSGGAGGRWREADLMGALAEQMGFPAARIQLDRASRTTYQSAQSVAKILSGDPKIPRYLVTSADHMPRAYMAFSHSGQRVCALPVDFNAIDQPPYEMLTPQLSALTKMARALHEYIGILFYYWVKFQ